jgi:CxxC motif-containing protein (DUF1111 family)
MVARGSARTLRRIGYGVAGLLGAFLVWSVWQGIAPGRRPEVRAEVKAAGLVLFTHDWKPKDPLAKGDGLGPVFNARSCVACHSQGGVGGGGDLDHNVLAFEAHPTVDRRQVRGGMVHKFAVDDRDREAVEQLRKVFPVVRRAPALPDFDPVRTESVNSTALFGAGLVDTIPSGSIVAVQRQQRLAKLGKEFRSDFRGAVPGRVRVLPDGRIGKFGWKAQFATLKEFVASACANELGLGTPTIEQAKPLARTVGLNVASGPKGAPDLDSGQVGALLAFVSALPTPRQVLPTDPVRRGQAERGQALFNQIGCAECHTPDVGEVTGVYTDFLLHRLDEQSLGGGGGYGQPRDVPPVPLPDDSPVAEEWRTPALWGVADSAPYFHDGASATLKAAIVRHRGDAVDVTEDYQALPDRDQQAIITFLKTLKAPTDAKPAEPVREQPSGLAMAR